MADIDFFKRANDDHGHQIGDQVLQAIARLLSESVRPEDVMARYGGEEFAVILPGIDEDGAMAMAERFRRAVEETAFCESDSVSIGITVGIGCASRQPEELTSEAFVKLADAALYQAKQTGRKRIVVINRMMSASGTCNGEAA